MYEEILLGEKWSHCTSVVSGKHLCSKQAKAVERKRYLKQSCLLQIYGDEYMFEMFAGRKSNNERRNKFQ